MRGEARVVAGVPLFGVSKRNDRLLSRIDGDARFVTFAYDLEWNRKISGPLSFAVASSGQIASRPLLAMAEMGLGGPLYARAYDYAERSGDRGILGSAEIRYDLARAAPHIVDRAETYVSIDGGQVGNLRHGSGGGSLLSSAAGIRLAKGRNNLAAEIAFPLNRDRFDTADRSPRISVRIARSF